jgi:hypothetical protein
MRLLGCDIMQSDRNLLIFKKSSLPPTSDYTIMYDRILHIHNLQSHKLHQIPLLLLRISQI